MLREPAGQHGHLVLKLLHKLLVPQARLACRFRLARQPGGRARGAGCVSRSMRRTAGEWRRRSVLPVCCSPSLTVWVGSCCLRSLFRPLPRPLCP
eukprot:scaffold136404_cov34-Tisochrysis_lutea.AAC.1